MGLPRWGSPRSGRRGDTGGGLQEVSPLWQAKPAIIVRGASEARSILIVRRCGLFTSPGLGSDYSERVPNISGTVLVLQISSIDLANLLDNFL